MIPLAFLLLSLQGVSELIKRIAFLRGPIDAKANLKKPQPHRRKKKSLIRDANLDKIKSIQSNQNKNKGKMMIDFLIANIGTDYVFRLWCCFLLRLPRRLSR